MFGTSRGGAKSRVASLQVIKSQSPFIWDEDDVRVWLKESGFGSVDRAFKKNAVNGELLCTLTDTDLIGMKVKQLGVRKSILRAVQKLMTGKKPSSKNAADDSDDSTSNTSTNSRSTTTSSGAFIYKIKDCEEGADFQVRFKDLASLKFSRLHRKLTQKLTYSPSIFFVGKITKRVEDDEDLQLLINKYSDGFSFEVKKPDVNDVTKIERDMLNGLVDVAIIADTTMKIIFVNKVITRMAGYTQEELIGKNVITLMPSKFAKEHPSYISSYLDGNEPKVIGKGGRNVELVKKDKTKVTCWLTVSEQKKSSGRHTFFGTLHEIKAKRRNEKLAKFSILDGIQKVVLVIDAVGTVQFLNQHAESLLGYDETFLGKNVKEMMPQPYCDAHDSYLRNYMKSGKAKIIGKGTRTVVAMRKDQSVVAVELGVSEVILEGKRYFIAVFEETSKANVESFTVLQEARGVVNSLSIPAIVIDQDRIVQAFNAAAEEFLGYDLVDVLGENVKMLMGPDDAKNHDGYVQAHIKTGIKKVIGKTRNVLAKAYDGTMIPAILSVSKITSDNGEDFVFTGVLAPAYTDSDSNASHSESSTSRSSSKNSSAASQQLNVMSSMNDNRIAKFSSFKDFGIHEDANKKHRSSMEDAWVCVDVVSSEAGSAFFGVYDGHGGEQAAEFTAKKLHKFFASKIARKVVPRKAFAGSYKTTHDTMGSEIGRSGCTALTVFLQKKGTKRTVISANVGDSRSLLISNGKVTRLSKDHKPTDPEEQELLKKKKAMIINGRISGILGVSRSLGDYKADKYIIRDPFFSETPVVDGDILILACDGLFDVCSDEEVLKIVLKNQSLKSKSIAKTLVATAIKKESKDNVTCMVIKL